jgi:hypothetical protein
LFRRRHDLHQLPKRFDTINLTRRTLAGFLEEEQENKLARTIAKLPDEKYVAIMRRARFYAFNYQTPSGQPILTTLACTLAAIDIIEGSMRPPARKRQYVYAPGPYSASEGDAPEILR